MNALGLLLLLISGANPYIPIVEKLYRDFEYEEALQEISKARAWGDNTTEDRVWLALMEGVLAIEVGDLARGREALERAISLAPDAVLPLAAAPRVRAIFEEVRKSAQPPPVATAEAPRVTVSEPPPLPQPSPAASTGAPVQWVASVRALGDPVGRALGAAVDAGIALAPMELRLRWIPGTRQAVGLDALGVWRSGRVGLHAGLRGTALPAAGAWGGGPLVGARFHFSPRLHAVGDVAAEWYAAPDAFHPFALVLTAGVGVTFGSAE